MSRSLDDVNPKILEDLKAARAQAASNPKAAYLEATRIKMYAKEWKDHSANPDPHERAAAEAVYYEACEIMDAAKKNGFSFLKPT